MKRVLLTGFEPFDEHKVNPSQEIAERLDGEVIAGAEVCSLVLPVVFGKDVQLALPAIDQINPALVLSLGLAAGTDSLDVEMFAINHRKGTRLASLYPSLWMDPQPTSPQSTRAASQPRFPGKPERRLALTRTREATSATISFTIASIKRPRGSLACPWASSTFRSLRNSKPIALMAICRRSRSIRWPPASAPRSGRLCLEPSCSLRSWQYACALL